MSESIYELVDDLPSRNLTVFALNSLDTFLPGEWDNPVSFEHTIRVVTRERDEALIQQIGERAIQLFTIARKATNAPCGSTKPSTTPAAPWAPPPSPTKWGKRYRC